VVINDLKTICPQCRGVGRTAGIRNLGISQINLAGVCNRCGGRGFLLTELGQDLLDLLRPFVEEMIAEAAPPPPQPKQDEEEE